MRSSLKVSFLRSISMTNCFLYLLLLLSPLISSLLLASVSAKVFVSIDCGSSTSYTDKHSIKWVGDDQYIQNGESYNVVAPEEDPGWDASHVMSTLRVFTTRKKNCYTIEADKGERVFIRASFFYGNYDNKSSIPTFDMHVDGNHWTRVIILSNNTFGYYEAAYTVKGDTLSVCLAQTQPDQFPFISSLEVRSLDEDVYSYIDLDYPLFFGARVTFGPTNITRYPDDDYDRIWHPLAVSNDSIFVTSDAPLISIDDAPDNPPISVIRTAWMSKNVSDPDINIIDDFSSYERPINFNTYFSEVSKLNSTQKRSFDIKVNNKTINKGGPIIPPYGGVSEFRIANLTPSNSTGFSLVPTSDSTLPPILNALEVFTVGDKQTEGTNSKDVNSLALLQKSFIQLADVSGDPCLPSPFTWDWVACSPDSDNPRITALYLSSLGLVGTLPDFSDMDALAIIDLHNNSLVQVFPDFLGSFPDLKVLNLANNNFSGMVPSSLSENKDLDFRIAGNPHLCLSTNKTCETGIERPSSTPQRSGNSKLKITNMLPIILLGTVFILVDVFWVILC